MDEAVLRIVLEDATSATRGVQSTSSGGQSPAAPAGSAGMSAIPDQLRRITDHLRGIEDSLKRTTSVTAGATPAAATTAGVASAGQSQIQSTSTISSIAALPAQIDKLITVNQKIADSVDKTNRQPLIGQFTAIVESYVNKIPGAILRQIGSRTVGATVGGIVGTAAGTYAGGRGGGGLSGALGGAVGGLAGGALGGAYEGGSFTGGAIGGYAGGTLGGAAGSTIVQSAADVLNKAGAFGNWMADKIPPMEKEKVPLAEKEDEDERRNRSLIEAVKESGGVGPHMLGEIGTLGKIISDFASVAKKDSERLTLGGLKELEGLLSPELLEIPRRLLALKELPKIEAMIPSHREDLKGLAAAQVLDIRQPEDVYEKKRAESELSRIETEEVAKLITKAQQARVEAKPGGAFLVTGNKTIDSLIDFLMPGLAEETPGEKLSGYLPKPEDVAKRLKYANVLGKMRGPDIPLSTENIINEDIPLSADDISDTGETAGPTAPPKPPPAPPASEFAAGVYDEGEEEEYTVRHGKEYYSPLPGPREKEPTPPTPITPETVTPIPPPVTESGVYPPSSSTYTPGGKDDPYSYLEGRVSRESWYGPGEAANLPEEVYEPPPPPTPELLTPEQTAALEEPPTPVAPSLDFQWSEFRQNLLKFGGGKERKRRVSKSDFLKMVEAGAIEHNVETRLRSENYNMVSNAEYMKYLGIIEQAGEEPPKFGRAGFAHGGMVGTDTIPAMLSPGEVVVPEDMVKSGAVDHLRGKLPGFAEGGEVSGPAIARGAGGAFAMSALRGVASSSDDPSSSIKRMGENVSKAGEMISMVHPAFGAIVKGAGDVVSAFGSLTKSIDGTVERYGEYSPEIAQAQAMAEIRQVMGDMRRAQEVSPQMAAYVEAQSDLQQKFEDVKVALLGNILPVITSMLEKLGWVMDIGGDVAAAVREILRPLAEIANWLGVGVNTQRESNTPPPDDPTSMLFRDNVIIPRTMQAPHETPTSYH